MENPGVQGWPDRATLTNRQGLFITHEPIGLSMLTVGFEYMADIIDNLIQHVVHCLIIFDLPVTIQKVIFEFTIQTIRSCTLLWIWEFCYIEEIEFLTYKIFFLGSSPILRSIPLALKPFNGMTILFPLNLYRQQLYTQSFSAFRTLGDCRFGRMICTIHKSRLTVSYAKIIFSA